MYSFNQWVFNEALKYYSWTFNIIKLTNIFHTIYNMISSITLVSS